MSRYTGPSWRLSRRLGVSLSGTGKELARRAYAPGDHGRDRHGKLSEYGTQLREKTKANFSKLGDNYQFIDIGQPIGHYVTNNGKVDIVTTRMKIHQSKNGYHAVPAKPKEMLENENHAKN